MNTGAPFPSVEVAHGRVLHFQRKLHEWASKDAERRFCDLWNLVCDPATLVVAWSRVSRNRGSRTAGVDAATRRHVEARGVDRFLSELREELRAGTLRPLPVRERLIPKRGGKRRLGIPALRDRTVQMALKLVLEPIFESDFYPSSYAYRPARRTQDAIAEIVHFTKAPSNYEWVIETDVEACFDRLSHCLILDEVRRRIKDKRVLGLIRAFLKAGLMTETGRLERTVTGTPQGGIRTAPTQKVTGVIGACGGRDRVADRDGVVVAADQDFADDESQDALLSGDVELVQAVGEAAEEPFERVGELQIGLDVVQLGVEAVELGLQRGLTLAQRGHPGAQLVERDELFLVCLDQPRDRGAGAGEIALERFAATGGGVLGPHCGEAAVDLGAHKVGVLEQPADLGPDERVELVSADWAAGAPLAVGMPPAVLTDAAVVADPFVARPRAGAVAGVAALAADEHALQQRQLLGVALGEVRVVEKAVLREREGLLGDERRNGDQRPVLGRLVWRVSLRPCRSPRWRVVRVGPPGRSAVFVFPNAACPR